MKALGDSHNNGKRVSLSDNGLVQKPRCLFWEWLFLSSESPLRQSLSQFEIQHFKKPAATFALPSLKFDFDRSEPQRGGQVEFLTLSTRETLTNDDLRNAGSVVALLCAFGITDLHLENIVTGIDCDGRFVFGPIDVESVFEKVALPSQTLLLPSREIEASNAGLHHLLKYVNSPEFVASFVCGFLEYLEFLENYEHQLNAVLAEVSDCNDAPLRVIPRSTKDYKAALDERSFSAFFNDEIAQLKRGDIPYFYRFIGSHEVFYFDNENACILARDDELFHSSRKRFRSIPKVLDSEMMPILKKAGALQLTRYFKPNECNSIFTGNFLLKVDSATISISRNEVYVQCAR